MDPSTNVCNIFIHMPTLKCTLLTWLKPGLAHVRRWSHRHGAAIDDYIRIYRYWNLQRKVIGTFRLKQCTMHGPQYQCVQYF